MKLCIRWKCHSMKKHSTPARVLIRLLQYLSFQLLPSLKFPNFEPVWERPKFFNKLLKSSKVKVNERILMIHCHHSTFSSVFIEKNQRRNLKKKITFGKIGCDELPTWSFWIYHLNCRKMFFGAMTLSLTTFSTKGL